MTDLRDGRYKGHTPGPWKWGTDWPDVEGTAHGFDAGGRGKGPKYADIALRGPDERDILPLAVDHYDIIWDDRYRETLTAPDRALIADAPKLLAELRAARAEIERLRDELEDLVEERELEAYLRDPDDRHEGDEL